MSSSGQMQQTHAPYLPNTAGLGGSPTKTLDDPITSVFLVLFVLGAISNMTILQVNLRRGHKFAMSGLLFGFCMARITTCTMRLVWSTHLTNVSIAIAAQIFVQAGVLVLFVVNLIFTQRIIRATHPNLGWAKTFSWAFKIYYGCIVALLVAIITVTVQSFYTLDKSIRKADRDVQLFVGTFFAVSAFLPIPLVLGSIIIPKKVRVEKFGSGKFRTKIYLILFTSVILTLGAAFRVGTNFVPRPRNNPAWYNSKACFYLFNFTIEIIVVALYIGIRVDKRFHVPDNSHKYGDYSRKPGTSEPEQDVEQQQEKVKLRPSLVDRVNTEEQIFDDLDADTQVGTPQPSQGVDVDGILTTNHAGRSPVDAFPALQAKKATSDALYQVHNRYMDVVKYSKTLDEVERNKLLKRWEVELADFTRASVGSSLHDWMNKDQNAPEEIPIDQTDSSRG